MTSRMTTVHDESGAPIRAPAVIYAPQPLGFLPTRQFWHDPENQRLATVPVGIVMWVFLVAAMVIISELPISPVLVACLVFVAMMTTIVLVRGLFERYIRRAAERRSRSNPKQLR
jgi:hypothetical protein